METVAEESPAVAEGEEAVVDAGEEGKEAAVAPPPAELEPISTVTMTEETEEAPPAAVAVEEPLSPPHAGNTSETAKIDDAHATAPEVVPHVPCA